MTQFEVNNMAKQKKHKSNKDAFYAREKAKYDRPIFSREYIMEFMANHGAPIVEKEIAKLLGLADDDDQKESLRRRVRAMIRDGQIFENRRGGLCVVDKKDLVSGRIIGHPDGFGFMKPDEGAEDLFLSPKQMRGVFHGDRVVARISGVDRRGRKEGVIIEVLSRQNSRIVGRFNSDKGVYFVVADNKRINHDIMVPKDGCGKAEHGQIVSVELIEQPSKRSRPIGKVVEVLGDHMAPGMEIDVALRSHDIPYDWPKPVLKQAKAYGATVPEDAIGEREDLRNVPFVTIDGEDARDFDDAVFCESKPKGWRLLVAIADVSYYVTPDSALDKEAIERGTSVYFPSQVIPMLPETLSNGLCSLNPGVDRLVLVCEMYINNDGKMTRSKFFRATIRSAARLTYTKVAALMGNKKPADLEKQFQWFLPQLESLTAVFHALLSARNARGAIDFDTVETKINFREDRKIESIVPTIRNDAHKLIEECMIMANVAAARWLDRKKLPALYRIHDGPTAEKLNDLRSFLAEFGVTLPSHAKIEPRVYAELVQEIKDRDDFGMMQTVMLRSLSQAVYSPDNIGHFGLAHPLYAHFTSPIRRYPDLMVHRALCHIIDGGTVEDFAYSMNDLVSCGEQCSMAERRADEASRDVMDWLKCEYLQDKIGEIYEGRITAVTGFGIFVELKDVYVEGLVHITSLAHDYYHFEPAQHRLKGERTGQVYRLADMIKVQVARVNLDDKKIDFELADKPVKQVSETPKKAAKKKPRRKKPKTKKSS